MAAKVRTTWRCQACGAGAPRWVGRCSECGEYGTYVEEIEAPASGGPAARHATAAPVPLDQVGSQDAIRTPTGVDELDLVLGGGLVTGSLVLLGGEPGIGKSTLLLQVADALASSGRGVLYVCGEESPQQVGLRARRLGVNSPGISLLPETDMAAIEAIVADSRPNVLVLDSIQTAVDPDLAGAPGSVGQVRACTARLTRLAKDLGVTTLLVGHVTKDGAIAGPRVLEHMVDAVLYFEGDRDHAFRVVRAVKNRFGSASEVGVFEMTDAGLRAVASPSAALLAERSGEASGSAVMVAVEGSRPLLVEIQALVTPSYLPAPRRLASGLDTARLLKVIAVMERRAALSFAGQDVLVSVAGGLRVVEPAAELPLALALASALLDRPLPVNLAGFGEVGLTGHVRPVAHAEARIREAARFGLERVMGAAPATMPLPGLTHVDTLSEALSTLS